MQIEIDLDPVDELKWPSHIFGVSRKEVGPNRIHLHEKVKIEDLTNPAGMSPCKLKRDESPFKVKFTVEAEPTLEFNEPYDDSWFQNNQAWKVDAFFVADDDSNVLFEAELSQEYDLYRIDTMNFTSDER